MIQWLRTHHFSLFPSRGQPGQWRVIADMKKGGQNQAIDRGPVYLPRVDTILPHMYTGGWSAVVDASKFFYQFKTLLSERKYLGLIHPITGKHYRYKGLPIGIGKFSGCREQDGRVISPPIATAVQGLPRGASEQHLVGTVPYR
jgi:hypothetical protein